MGLYFGARKRANNCLVLLRKHGRTADNGSGPIRQDLRNPRINANQTLETEICRGTMSIDENGVKGWDMDTSVRDLTCEIVEPQTNLRMTEERRADQLVKLVYGNVHVEHPGITMDLARTIVQERRAAGTLNA